MQANFISQIFVVLGHGLASFFLLIIYLELQILSSISLIFEAFYTNPIMNAIYYVGVSISSTLFVIGLFYNYIQSKINGLPLERISKMWGKSLFGLLVLGILPLILNFTNTFSELTMKEISAVITGQQGNCESESTECMQQNELIIASIFSLAMQVDPEVCDSEGVCFATGAQTAVKWIEANDYDGEDDFSAWYLEEFKPEDMEGGKYFIYSPNYFFVAVISVLYVIPISILIFKLGKKSFEQLELVFLLPYSTLSFSKEGGTMFTRTITAIASCILTIDILEFSVILFGVYIKIMMDVVSNLSGLSSILVGFTSFIVTIILLFHLAFGNNKLASLLETDGAGFAPGRETKQFSSVGMFIGGALFQGGKNAANHFNSNESNDSSDDYNDNTNSDTDDNNSSNGDEFDENNNSSNSDNENDSKLNDSQNSDLDMEGPDLDVNNDNNSEFDDNSDNNSQIDNNLDEHNDNNNQIDNNLDDYNDNNNLDDYNDNNNLDDYNDNNNLDDYNDNNNLDDYNDNNNLDNNNLDNNNLDDYNDNNNLDDNNDQ